MHIKNIYTLLVFKYFIDFDNNFMQNQHSNLYHFGPKWREKNLQKKSCCSESILYFSLLGIFFNFKTIHKLILREKIAEYLLNAQRFQTSSFWIFFSFYLEFFFFNMKNCIEAFKPHLPCGLIEC